MQWVESYPDANDNVLRHDIDGQYDTFLSSVQFTSSKYYSTSPMYGTWSYGLYNFSTLSSTSDSLSAIMDRNDLSSYDVVIKHKGPHPNPRQLEGLEDQCSAVVEYMPLSSLIGSSNHTGDANSAAHNLSSIYLSADGQYQLYNFDKNGISYPYEGYVSDFEVVVREKYTSQHNGSQINYLPLSSFNLPGDTNIADYSRRKSIELFDDAGTKYYELYKFHDLGNAITSLENSNGFDVVVRDYSFPGGLPHISYVRLSALNTAISGDANIIPNDQNSIATVSDGQGNVWQQLYGLGDTGVISAVMAYDNGDHYIMNEGLSWTNPNKQFLYYDYIDKRLKYGDICLYMPKVRAADLDDDVLPEISDVIIPELSTIISAEISAQLSALDDRYWIKGEDNTENYGSSIGNSSKTQVIDLDNKSLVCSTSAEHWHTGSLYADYDLKAQVVEANYQLKIGNTTLNETQLQQLLSLLNAP